MWHVLTAGWNLINDLWTATILGVLALTAVVIVLAQLATWLSPQARATAKSRRTAKRAAFRAKPRGARILLRLAFVWLGLVLLFNLAAICGAFIGSKGLLDGWRQVQDVYGPFSFGTYIINAVLLSPAAGAYEWASRIERRAGPQSANPPGS
jgi:ABC-type Fe3+ transport system permease subunit